jgi:uncharacterized protein (TIGR04255 family)
MNRRPADLPDFGNPPLTEVVVGVQLNSLDGFLAPYLGGVWDLFRDDFESAEEHHPLPPVFETFGQIPQVGLQFPFRIATAPELPRVFLVNRDRTRLLQVQRDRFIHNWRKIGDHDDYPRFESILATFTIALERFSSFIKEKTLGIVETTQCEVTYINHIIVPPDKTFFDVMDILFDRLIQQPSIPDLGRPEDGRLLLRYVIPGLSGAPLGRLIVSTEPARRADGVNVIQLSLTARGAPTGPDIASVVAFMTTGRSFIVRGFKAITSGEMHNKWGLKQ